MFWTVEESKLRLELENLKILGKQFLNTNFGGYGCGYVFLPLDHIWYGINYDDLNTIFDNENFFIHGTISYADFYENNYWKIGFDTNNYGDNLNNWTKENVEIETKRLYDFCYSKYKLTDRKNKLKKNNLIYSINDN